MDAVAALTLLGRGAMRDWHGTKHLLHLQAVLVQGDSRVQVDGPQRQVEPLLKVLHHDPQRVSLPGLVNSLKQVMAVGNGKPTPCFVMAMGEKSVPLMGDRSSPPRDLSRGFLQENKFRQALTSFGVEAQKIPKLFKCNPSKIPTDERARQQRSGRGLDLFPDFVDALLADFRPLGDVGNVDPRSWLLRGLMLEPSRKSAPQMKPVGYSVSQVVAKHVEPG